MRGKPKRNWYFNKQEQAICGTKAWMAQLFGTHGSCRKETMTGHISGDFVTGLMLKFCAKNSLQRKFVASQ